MGSLDSLHLALLTRGFRSILHPCYTGIRDRRFRKLSEGELERLRIASEAQAAARAKAAKKSSKKGGAKAKKATAVSSADKSLPPTPGAGGQEVEPPSLLEEYENVRREVEEHRAFRREEIAIQRAKESLIPRDPAGEVVMEEVRAFTRGVGVPQVTRR